MANPYAGTYTNPYSTAKWNVWQQPQDETARYYYTDHPREAWQQAQGAFGQPGGNLQHFLDSQFGQVWSDYIKQSELSKQGGAPGLNFTDTLTPDLFQHLQNRWQGQTADKRGENYAPNVGAMRRV